MSEWKDVSEKPQDDQTVMVIYKKEDVLGPIRAYYDEEEDNFYPLDSFFALPLKVTHWCYLPKLK